MTYKTTYRVIESQIDATDHLSNVQYYAFFKTALYSFLRDYQFSELVAPKNLWPVVFTEQCHFYKEIYFDETITLEMHFSALSSKHHKWTCEIILYNQRGEKAAHWISQHGIMNRETRKIESLPEKAVELIKQFMQ